MASITTVEKQILSGSTNGRRIKVTQTATPGTLIHTATNTSGEIDYVTLYVTSRHSTEITLVLEWGGVTDPDDQIRVIVPANDGDHLAVAALPLRGGLVIRAFCATTAVLTVSGSVERAVTE